MSGRAVQLENEDLTASASPVTPVTLLEDI